MAVPDFQTLMLPVLEIVSKGEATASEVTDRTSNIFNLSDEDRNQKIPSGSMPTIRNRVHWALTYLTKAELMERPKRGLFRITDLGVNALAKKPARIDMKFLEQFEGYRAFKLKSGTKSNDSSIENAKIESSSQQTPEDLIMNALNNHQETKYLNIS